jgi:hypothetical protein
MVVRGDYHGVGLEVAGFAQESNGDAISLFIPVILQVAGVLAFLFGSSLSLTPSGPLLTVFKSAPGRFVAHPNHLPE